MTTNPGQDASGTANGGPPIGETVFGETTMGVPPLPQTSRSGAGGEGTVNAGGGKSPSGQHVAEVAKDEASHVAHEVKAQAKGLLSGLGEEVYGQTAAQQQRVATGLRSLGDELSSMADKPEASGVATQLVNQAAGRVSNLAGWLENRDPGSVLEDVSRFGRQRPGAFLALAAGAGILAGRLTRGLAEETSDAASYPPPGAVPPEPGYPPAVAVPPVTDYGTGTVEAGLSPEAAPAPLGDSEAVPPRTVWEGDDRR